jgi:hypothetical protein
MNARIQKDVVNLAALKHRQPTANAEARPKPRFSPPTMIWAWVHHFLKWGEKQNRKPSIFDDSVRMYAFSLKAY